MAKYPKNEFGDMHEAWDVSQMTAEEKVEFLHLLQSGNVVLAPGAEEAMKEQGLTIDDVIASLLKSQNAIH